MKKMFFVASIAVVALASCHGNSVDKAEAADSADVATIIEETLLVETDTLANAADSANAQVTDTVATKK